MFGIRPDPVMAPPSIAVSLAINPPSFALGAKVELSIAAVPDSSGPITIYTWTNIFYPRLSQERGSLVEADRDTLEERRLHIIDVNRMEAINFTLGGPEDELFVTLEPGRPAVFKTTFAYGCGGGYPKSKVLPGHRYLVDLQERESVDWRKEGRKEDVLYVPGQKNRTAFYSDGKPIPLSLDEPIEFKVLPLDD